MNDPFIVMYDRYFDDIYRFVWYKTGNKWDTDDLVADIFRKALQSFDTVRLKEEQQKRWLVAIARNTVIDYYRRRKEVVYGHDPEVFGYVQTAELLDSIDLRQDCLKLSLQSLTVEEQEIINLKYMTGLKYAEIGEIVGKAEAWLKMKVHRMKQKLAKFITECMEVQQ